MDDGDELWAVKTTKSVKEVISMERKMEMSMMVLQVATVEVDENSYMYDIGEESGSYVVWFKSGNHHILPFHSAHATIQNVVY